MQKDIQWYIKRGGGNKRIMKDIVTKIILLMTPFTPHLAEELWHEDHETYVSTDQYPIFNPSHCSDVSEVNEYLIQQLLDDSQQILKVTGIKPKKICFYISPQWKQTLYKKAIELNDKQLCTIGILMKDAMADPILRTFSKEVSKIAGKLASDIKKLNDTDKKRYRIDINEHAFLNSEKRFLEKNFSCSIEIYEANDEKRYDPAGKARHAEPLRPAIYVE
jgi:leucyl-tRNA synthetase